MKVKITGYKSENVAATADGKLIRIAVNAIKRPVPGDEIEARACPDGYLRPVDEPKK